MNASVRAFIEAADVSVWTGLPDVGPDELGATQPWLVSQGEAGDPLAPRRRIEVPPGCFAAGLRCWVDDAGRALVLEGRAEDTEGGRVDPPDLGEPELRLPTRLGSLSLPDGELVFAEKGLSVRINPENGVLLGLVGFASTTAEDYVSRLRPAQPIARPLAMGGAR